MTKKKQPVDDGHRMGKFCGYVQLPNGDLRVAPTYCQQMQDISDKAAALNETARAFTHAMQQLYEPITAANRRLFARVAEDYGIDLNRVAMTLNHETGVLTMRPIPSSVGKSAEQTK